MLDINFHYKLRARGKWDWREFDTVRMEISVGQPYHEGAKLEAAMDWARENFKRRVIILGDSPQRYNLMFKTGFKEENAEKIARGAGDSWLQRNQEYLKGIEITRWNEWKQASTYLMNRAAVSRLYNENVDFRNSIHNAMQAFTERNPIAGETKDRFCLLSEQYLLEETSVFATAYNALGGISAYPGDFLTLWEMFIDNQNPLVPQGLRKAHHVRLTFDKRHVQVPKTANL